MTTADHVLILTSTWLTESQRGARKVLFTGSCSSCGWHHPQSTREVIREAFEEHFGKVTERRDQ